MKESDLELFWYRSERSAKLVFSGERNGERLVTGVILAGDVEIGRVTDGVATFVERGSERPPEEIEKLRTSEQIPKNWANGISRGHTDPITCEWCNSLAAVDGVIMELAAGPGGGLLAPVLERNPTVRALINDISEDVLALWGEFLAQMDYPNVCLAAFDGRKMPLRDGTVAAISSHGGFSSIGGGTSAMREAYRVLQPGGPVLSTNLMVDQTDWAKMPRERRLAWEGSLPGLVQGEAKLLQEAGFAIESREIAGGRALDPEEGGLSMDAAEHGVRLHVRFEWVRARKPLR